MTSKVTVEAHCPDYKAVVITLTEVATGAKSSETIKNGEKRELYIYDDRIVSAQEIEINPL